MKTKYYIDWKCEKYQGNFNAYHQIVRSADDAILYANENLDNIFLYCFHAGISKDDITIL